MLRKVVAIVHKFNYLLSTKHILNGMMYVMLIVDKGWGLNNNVKKCYLVKNIDIYIWWPVNIN